MIWMPRAAYRYLSRISFARPDLDSTFQGRPDFGPIWADTASSLIARFRMDQQIRQLA